MPNGDFTISVRNVDTLPHSTQIIDRIRASFGPIFERAGMKLRIQIDRGIQDRKSDVELEFDREPKFTGPGTGSVYGNAEGTRAYVYVDNHREQRLGGGVRVRPHSADRDHSSQVQSVFNRDSRRLADFLATTAVEEIGHILLGSARHSSDPGNAMCPLIPRQARFTASHMVRALSTPRAFNHAQQQQIFGNLRSGAIGVASSIEQFGPNTAQARAINQSLRQRANGTGVRKSPFTYDVQTRRQVGQSMLDRYTSGKDPYLPKYGSFSSRERRRYNTFMELGLNPLAPGKDPWSHKPYAFAGDLRPHEPLDPTRHWVFEPEVVHRSGLSGAFGGFGH